VPVLLQEFVAGQHDSFTPKRDRRVFCTPWFFSHRITFVDSSAPPGDPEYPGNIRWSGMDRQRRDSDPGPHPAIPVFFCSPQCQSPG
jgi:hypothetical protein